MQWDLARMVAEIGLESLVSLSAGLVDLNILKGHFEAWIEAKVWEDRE